MKLVNTRGMDRILQDYKNQFEELLIGPLYALAFAKILSDPPQHIKVVKKDNITFIYNENNKPNNYNDGYVISFNEKKSEYKIRSVFSVVDTLKDLNTNINKIKKEIDSYPGRGSEIASDETKKLYQNICNKFLNNKTTQSTFISKNSFSEHEPILDMSQFDSYHTIRKLVELAYPKLAELKIMDTILNENFIPTINKEAGLQEHNEIFKEELKKLFKYAKGTSSKKQFDFNDLDNAFYFKKNVLILKNQNYALEIQEKDGVYSIVTINNPHETEDLLKNNSFTFDGNKNNFTINSLDEPFTLAYFLLELNCAVAAYEEANSIEEDKETQEIVKSYEYYLAYNSKKYGFSKEDCVWRILFYGFPGGGQPDGSFNYNSREYLPYEKSVEAKMSTIHNTIIREPFKCAVVYDGNVELCKKITTLNESWLRMFVDAKEMVTDFINRYDNASLEEKDKMLVFKDAQEKNYADLKEFLIIADNLISKNTVSNKPLKV